jgi:hypothetical protein
MNRGQRTLAGYAMLVALLIAALAPARADQWTVEKSGFNLYRITGRTIGGENVFIRTQGCDDAPAAGVVDVQKDGSTRRLTFSGSPASCTVVDFLVPAKVESDQYHVLLTQDQSKDWYQVTDSDMYLKTTGCFTRSLSEPALVDLKRDGTGWIIFADQRRCLVEHAFRRMPA